MTDTPALVASRSLAAMIDGYLTTELLYLAAALQHPGHLAAGPQSSHGLALRTGVDSLTMYRLLRGLAAEGVLDEQSGAAFALTDLGAAAPVRPISLARAELASQSVLEQVRLVAGDFFSAVPTGGTATSSPGPV